MNDKAIALIGLNLSNLVLMNVSKEKTTMDLWEILGKLYESKSPMNLKFLKNKLYSLEMRDGDRVINHLNSFNTLGNQLNTIGDEVKNVEQFTFFLYSLPNSCDNLIVVMSGSTKVENLKLDEVVGQLLQEEIINSTFEPVVKFKSIIDKRMCQGEEECKIWWE
jgi:hypothetical protein